MAGAGGALLWLAFPSWNLWPLALLAPAMLSWATHRRSPWQGAVLGMVFGLAFMLPLLSWAGVFVGAVPWVALAVSQALFYAALGAGCAALSRLPGAAWWSACLWVAVEAARSRWPFGGLPWGRLAFSQADSPLAQLAAVGGVPLVSFAVALTGTQIAAVMVSRSQPRPSPDRSAWPRGGPALLSAMLPMLVSVPLWASAFHLSPASSTDTGRAVTVAVIQGNVPRAGLDFNAQRRAVLDNHVQATLDLAAAVDAGTEPAPRLVIWPENSSDIDPLTNPDAAAHITQAAQAIGVPILIGAVLEGPGENLTNAGIVWDPVTGPGQQYAKRHPVPFGEYMPARSFFRLFSDQVDLLERDFVAGEEVGLLDIAGVPVGDVICFEVAYDGLVSDVVEQGARLLVVQTNNATFGFTDESPQQLAMSRLRAIEHDRTVIVSATSGLSAVIDPDGTVVDESELFRPWQFVGPVTLAESTTLATRVGAAPEAALSLAALAALVAATRPAVRRRRTAHAAAPATSPALSPAAGDPDRTAQLPHRRPRGHLIR
ncbi:apolipoprotein N-acyltransferase [Modestobacter sp. Leaf380]|uniref:apolipoprotein N-acyltransferase n=1 Tax=Modestobacter sp. Leaf380 TaxID=1736356 RepID=UPI000B1158A5|nr:apolipoprotein N-acyltransferase [Modestobacter sp. Leaf380]